MVVFALDHSQTPLPPYQMITVISGLPGAGKSAQLARIAISLLYRNRRYFKRSKKRRLLYTNLKLAPAVLAEFDGFVREWVDPAELVKIRDADVLWDEIATHLDSTQWQNMSLELKRWLQQHRKFGIELYGTAQDFAQVDKSFRRLTSDLIHVTKLFGTRDKSATRPEVKHVFVISLKKTLDPQIYDELTSKFGGGGLPWPMLITKKDIEIFDTTAEVKMGKYPPLRHIERECEDVGCGHVKTLHV